jgi:anti-sigma factor RsiW
VSYPATDCVCARESISAQLDGELPERELDRLETHLRLCPACTAWADEVRDVTRQLREASLETPLEPFIRSRLRRSWRVSSAVAVASAAAVIATMFVASDRHGASVELHAASASTPLLRTQTLARLEDGKFAPITIVPFTFRPV